MGYIQGEGRNQATLFPVVLDDFVPEDHVCRVIDAFVGRLVMADLGFDRALAAETGRPGYDPRFAETVSVRLSKPDSLLATLGS
jgi:transposase